MVGSGSPFLTADWCVFAIYLAALAGGGYLARRGARDARDFFVGHGQMPAWAVSLSVLASATSVATYLGAPDSSFRGNLTYLAANLGTIIAVCIVAWCFIPIFYRFRVVTVYELIGNAFGPRAKTAASVTFLIGRLLASGARLFFAAIPAAAVLCGATDSNVPALVIGVVVITLIATSYTLAGGISSIIWTDVVQLVVAIVAVVAVGVVLFVRIPLHATAMLQVLSHAGAAGGSKLQVLNFSFDRHVTNTVWTALSGYLLLNLAVYGTDQDLAQRMLTCKNALSGGRSAILSIIMNIPVTLLFMSIGLLLYVFYHGPPGTAWPHHPLASTDAAFISFIVYEQPPGLAGLVMAGIFAIAFTSLLSAINALAAAVVNDLYHPLRPLLTPAQLLRASRVAVVGSGMALGLVAVACIFWHRASPQTSLLDFALSVVIVPYSGMLGIFLTAIFSRRGNGASACLALVGGAGATCVLQCCSHAQTEPWSHLALAWPWQMVIGTLIATAICGSGRRRTIPDPGHALA